MDFHVCKVPKISEAESDELTEKVVVQCYRKGDRDKGLPPVFVLEVEEERAENAQLLALMYAQRHYYVHRTQWRGELLEPISITPSEDSQEDELAIATSIIGGQSCIPCSIQPKIISPHGRPVTQDTPSWLLEAVRMASERTNVNAYEWVDPTHVPRLSWISTSNTTGLLTTLRHMVRDRLEVNLTPKDVTLAFMYYLADCGWKGEKVKLAPLNYDTISKIEVPWKNSSGLCLSYTHSMKTQGVKVQYSPTGSKAAMREAEMFRMASIVSKLKEEIDSWGFPDDYMVDPKFFPIMLTKIAEKPEVRSYGDDPTKVRVIFMVCLLELFLDKLCHSQFMNFAKSTGSNAIGTNWGRGDAAFYAEKHHATGSKDGEFKPSDYIHACGDARKLDLSIKAKMLVMMSLLSGVCWDKDDPWYKYYMNLLAWSANITAQKYCYWPDMTVRLVKGLVFSGKFTTSYLDTMSLDLAFRDYMTCVFRKIKKDSPKKAERFWRLYKERHIVWTIYGDDFLLTFLKEFSEYMGIEDLADFLMRRWDIEVKGVGTDSYQTEHFFTSVDKYDNILQKGIVFLKRYFVWVKVYPTSKPYVGLWRPTKDYFVRSAVTGTAIDDPAVALGRIYQLMRDTMGTNGTAWRFLEATADALIELFPFAPDQLAEIEPDSPKMAKLKEITKKLGITAYDDKWTIVRRPTRSEILSTFVPKYDYQTIKALRETKLVTDHLSLLSGVAA